MIDPENRLKLALYHHRRGMRMLYDGKGLDADHEAAFRKLAAQSFEARDYCLTRVRNATGFDRGVSW